MNTLRFTILCVAIALLVLWRALLQPMGMPIFPLAALMVFPLIYYRWLSTLAFALIVGLVWESATPLPFGAVALPLAVGCVLFQMLGRHQFRANLVAKIVCAALLQSIVTIAIGLKFPPQTFAGAALQLFETLAQLLCAAILCPVWLWGMERLALKRFNIDLEDTLKNL